MAKPMQVHKPSFVNLITYCDYLKGDIAKEYLFTLYQCSGEAVREIIFDYVLDKLVEVDKHLANLVEEVKGNVHISIDQPVVNTDSTGMPPVSNTQVISGVACKYPGSGDDCCYLSINDCCYRSIVKIRNKDGTFIDRYACDCPSDTTCEEHQQRMEKINQWIKSTDGKGQPDRKDQPVVTGLTCVETNKRQLDSVLDLLRDKDSQNGEAVTDEPNTDECNIDTKDCCTGESPVSPSSIVNKPESRSVYDPDCTDNKKCQYGEPCISLGKDGNCMRTVEGLSDWGGLQGNKNEIMIAYFSTKGYCGLTPWEVQQGFNTIYEARGSVKK